MTTRSEGDRRSSIHAAAIAQFSKHGFAGTSMANIADAAGMSRPALYQYFRNKSDIFAAAFIKIFDECTSTALSAIRKPESTFNQLNGFLQSYEGDLWETMAASPHTDELINAKDNQTMAAIADLLDQLWAAMAEFLDESAPDASPDQKRGWLDLLKLSPKGFRFDQPTVQTYRLRLTALAQSVASDIHKS